MHSNCTSIPRTCKELYNDCFCFVLFVGGGFDVKIVVCRCQVVVYRWKLLKNFWPINQEVIKLLIWEMVGIESTSYPCHALSSYEIAFLVQSGQLMSYLHPKKLYVQKFCMVYGISTGRWSYSHHDKGRWTTIIINIAFSCKTNFPNDAIKWFFPIFSTTTNL